MKLISRVTARVLTSLPNFLISFRFLLLIVQFHLNGTFHVIAEFPTFVLCEVHCESSYLLRLNLISIVNMVLALNGKHWHVNFLMSFLICSRMALRLFPCGILRRLRSRCAVGTPFWGKGNWEQILACGIATLTRYLMVIAASFPLAII
jgi:hypothetical protein